MESEKITELPKHHQTNGYKRNCTSVRSFQIKSITRKQKVNVVHNKSSWSNVTQFTCISDQNKCCVKLFSMKNCAPYFEKLDRFNLTTLSNIDDVRLRDSIHAFLPLCFVGENNPNESLRWTLRRSARRVYSSVIMKICRGA